MELTDEISEYLSDVDDVLTYYSENGQVKYVSTVSSWLKHSQFIPLFIAVLF